MQLVRVAVQNFGPFCDCVSIPIGSFTTIVGRNDVGKSYFLRALGLFLNDSDFREEYVCRSAPADLETYIELSIVDFPDQLEIEDGVPTTLTEEKLRNRDGLVTVRKTYTRADLKSVRWSLSTYDYAGDVFSSLAALKEEELNLRGPQAGLTFARSSPGNTNKSKRAALRLEASNRGIPVMERRVDLPQRSPIIAFIKTNLPSLEVFVAEDSLDTSAADFQAPFRPLLKTAIGASSLTAARGALETGIQQAVQAEVDQIFAEFQNYTDEFTALQASAVFAWDKSIQVSIQGTDRQGVTQDVERRGSGFRRVLMVAYFRHLARKQLSPGGCQVIAIEEPENSLHPGLQRDLVESFREISSHGSSQILATSHSPVFAGSANIDDLVLITRSHGKSTASFGGLLDLAVIASELGIEPADQVTGFKACVFVEGPQDADALRSISQVLKAGGSLPISLDDAGIGVIPCGGDNLKHFLTRGLLKQLSRRFGVLIDSDRTSPSSQIHRRKLNWQSSCTKDGGVFHILQKRELENYLHPNAIRRGGGGAVEFDDFTDVKEVCGPNAWRYFSQMTRAELDERDAYTSEHGISHELTEVLAKFLEMTRLG